MKNRRLIVFIFIIAYLFTWVTSTHAIEIPPTGTVPYIQTNGAAADIGLGDWYTSNANGSTPGYHYFEVNIPCGWPTSTPIYIDLFSPEMNSTVSTSDEINGAPDITQFELYAPGTVVGPATNSPAPGTGIAGTQTNYAPSGAAQQWIRFYTITNVTPATCGTYIVRSGFVLATADDQNGWRLRVGADDDGNPNTLPGNTYDNPDGLAGTNDEITLGLTQTSFQQDQAVCFTLYQYVDPGLPSIAFHNFDMDDNQRVRYYSPTDAYDPSGQTGGTVGTVSGETAWNNGTQTSRGAGDVITNPISGWWRIVTCMNNDNQIIQEGMTSIAAFYTQPPTPRMTLTKTDNVTTTTPGSTLTYVVNFSNVSNNDPVPGAATNVVITDAIPANSTYVSGSCAINAPFTGTCNYASGVVTFNITGSVNAGASGNVTFQVTVNGGAIGQVVNTAEVNYRDSLNNPFMPVTATDTDTLGTARNVDLAITKTDNAQTYTAGSQITYTIVASNNGPIAVTGATVTDTIPAAITGTSWTCIATSGATCTAGPVSGNINDIIDLPVGGIATYTVTGMIAADTTGALTNTASIAPPEGITDVNPANNIAVDTDVPPNSPLPTAGFVPTGVASFDFADPAIVKLVDPALALAGETVYFTVIVTNRGNVATSDITVVDILPSTLEVQSVSTPQGTYTTNGNVVTFILGSVRAGQVLTMTITARIRPDVTPPQDICNSVTLQPYNLSASTCVRATQGRLPNTGLHSKVTENQPAIVPALIGVGFLGGLFVGYRALRKRQSLQ